jgi:hypothetical protein
VAANTSADDEAIARMHAKLANKLTHAARVAAPNLDVTVSVRPPPKLLDWLDPEPGKRGYYSACKRYSVCDVTIGRVTYWECWKLAKGGAWFTQLAVGLRSDAEARAAAQKDSESR